MNRFAFALPLFCFAVTSFGEDAAKLAAETPKPADPLADAAAAAKPVGRYELKNRSAFNVPAGTRTPFLPIGYVKPNGAAPIAPQQVVLDPSGFRLTSILIGNPSLAVINGRSYEEGQYLRMPRSAAQMRVRLYRIGDGQVWLQSDEKLFPVPLKRPELGERKIEEPLLSEERDVVPEVPGATPTPASTAKAR